MPLLKDEYRLAIPRLKRKALLLGLLWLLRRNGFAGARRLGALFGDVQYYLAVRMRFRCRAGAAAVLGLSPQDPQVSCALRAALRVNTTGALEVLSMVDRKLDSQQLHRLCRVDGVENLQAARTGRGAILLPTHSGNGLLLAAQLADRGWPITLVYRKSPVMAPQFIAAGLAHYGFEGIAANDGLLAYARLVDALRRDRVVFAMMDDGVRDEEAGVPLRFLGKDMRIPSGLVQLARQSRAPLVPVTSLSADPVWHFRIEPRFALVPGGCIEEDTAAVAKYVERQILAHPDMWSWHHRRWRKYPLPKCG